MKSVWPKLRSTRAWALALTTCVALVCAWGLYQSLNPTEVNIPGGLDLRGTWEFHNGSVDLVSIERQSFGRLVEVPKPLPDDVRAHLAQEFWYRRIVQLPENLKGKDLDLSLGSVKGRHEIYWNGKRIGAGGKTGVRVQSIPASETKLESNTIAVRVFKSESLFPGIVHLTAISLAEAGRLDGLEGRYYFEVGFKPLLPAAFKLALFFLFAGLFLTMPNKREYFSFSLFSLFSAMSAALFSRFMPGYEELQFRIGIQFLLSTLSLGCLPWLTADFLRVKNTWRSFARGFGASLVIVFVGAALLIEPSKRVSVYQITSAWMPLFSGIPAVVACAWAFFRIPIYAVHRKVQIQVFGLCILISAITWGALGPALLSFQNFVLPEVLDLMIFAGISSAMALEMKASNNRSDRVAKIVPKWLKGFLASGVAELKLEIPMVAMKVDTVGYTKTLALLSAEGKEKLHADIRQALADLTKKFGAQKLSDGGDGALFGWDLPVGAEERIAVFSEVTAACRFLCENAPGQLKFRMGLSAGPVRCELRGSDYSFLGEALNSAARMESLASPGVPLVDESLVALLGSDDLGAWIESELKGVVYRGKPLSLVA